MAKKKMMTPAELKAFKAGMLEAHETLEKQLRPEPPTLQRHYVHDVTVAEAFEEVKLALQVIEAHGARVVVRLTATSEGDPVGLSLELEEP